MRRQQGFTYLGLVILVAIIGLVGAAGLKVGSLLQRAAAEEELLEIGAEFSRALKSYADATPRGHPPFPATLNELLRDPRVPGVRRHLRRIYVDPLTGKAEWGLVTMGENAGVLGVYSLSNAKPLKLANFDARFTGLENKEKISEWKFMAPGQTLLPGGAPQAGNPPRAALPSLFGPQRAVPAPAPAQVAQPVQPPPVPQPVPPPSPADPAPPPAEPEKTEKTEQREKSEEDRKREAGDEQQGDADADAGKEEKDERADTGGVRGNRAR